MRKSKKSDAVAAESASEMVPLDLTIKPRLRDRERTTRRKLSAWDRFKYTLLLGGLFGFYWWQKIDDNPIKSVNDAFWETVRDQAWILVLLALEWIRQIHFLVAERSSRYYQFWKVTVFGRFEGRSERLDPWTRYRVARVLRWIFAIVVVSVVLGQITNQSPMDAMVSLPSRINDALPFALRLLIYPLILISQFVMLFWFLGRGGVETYYPDDIDTRFDDVWGQDPVREKVRENLIFLENPEAIEDRGGYTPGGILLYGPPGTGKTLLAEAAAGETGKPFVFVDPGAFINMFMGVGIIKVRSLFRKLRKLALRYGGVVVFFDEADSLGNRGGGGTDGGFASNSVARFLDDATDIGSAIPYLSSNTQRELWRSALDAAPKQQTKSSVMMMGGGGGGSGTLQALLAELSGLKKPRGFFNRTVRKALGMRPKPPPRYRILVMMASNMPEALDDAMLRPGRIDRIYKVGYPTKEGRIRTYEGYLAKVRHCLTPDDVEKLATMTPYATGAKIKDTVNEALINAIRDGREIITWADIVKAKQLKEHGLADDFHYVEHERHAIAVHEACHAVAVGTLCAHRMIDVATIERRGDVGGFVSYVPPEDRFTEWRSEYDTDIQVSLASLAGERMLFDGDNSSGVGGDLRSATRLATLMVGYWGMGSTFTSHAVSREFGIGGGGGGGGPGGEGDREEDLLRTGLGDQVEQRLNELFDEVSAMLASHRLQVLAVAHTLETHLTITGEDVMAIIECREGPFIDGAGYYRPEAIEKLDAYHSAVLDYRRNGILDLPPLPEIEGVTGRIVSSVAARVIEEPVPEPVDAASNAEAPQQD